MTLMWVFQVTKKYFKHLGNINSEVFLLKQQARQDKQLNLTVD